MPSLLERKSIAHATDYYRSEPVVFAFLDTRKTIERIFNIGLSLSNIDQRSKFSILENSVPQHSVIVRAVFGAFANFLHHIERRLTTVSEKSNLGIHLNIHCGGSAGIFENERDFNSGLILSVSQWANNREVNGYPRAVSGDQSISSYISGLLCGIRTFLRNGFGACQQLELYNSDTTQNRSENYKEQRKSRDRVGSHLGPEGSISFASILYGLVFFSVLLMWRLGGGR